MVDTSMLTNAKPVDIAGSVAKGDAVRSQRMSVEDMAADQRDNQILQEYAAIPETDLYTGDGLTKAVKHLQGRVSMKAFNQLAEHRTKAITNETQYKANLAKADAAALDREDEDTEFIMSHLAPVVAEPDPEKRKLALEDALIAAGEAKRADGTPRITPVELDNIRKMNPMMVDSMFYTSKTKKKMLEAAKSEAEITKSKALSESYSTGGGRGKSNVYTDGQGGTYRVLPNGTGERQDPETLQWTPTALPSGLRPVGAKVDVDKGKVTAELLDFDKNPPSAAEEQMARTYMVSRKMESLGQNSPLRPRIAMLAAKMATDEGRSVLADNAVYKQEAAAAANLSKQYAVIKAGEETVLNNLELMKPIINRVDSTGVPVVERWIRAGKRAVEGDPDVTQLDALIVSTQADIAKVLSASTGAGGVPVAALMEAKKYLSGDLTKQQFDAVFDIVPKEMVARTSAMEKQIEHSLSKIRSLTSSPDKQAPKPLTGSGMDTARMTVEEARAELQQARNALRSEQDPMRKEFINQVISDLTTKIQSAGGASSSTPAVAGEWKDLGGGVRVRVR